MLYYLQHVKKPRDMSPRDFSLRWNKMLRHTALLEKHYEQEPNEVKRKLMYMQAYTKTYHQRFISAGKKFEEMNKEEFTQYLQILHMEEKETKPRGTSRTEGNARGSGGHATNETHKGSRRNESDSHTHHKRSSECRGGQKIANQCTFCSMPREFHECCLHNPKYEQQQSGQNLLGRESKVRCCYRSRS